MELVIDRIEDKSVERGTMVELWLNAQETDGGRTRVRGVYGRKTQWTRATFKSPR